MMIRAGSDLKCFPYCAVMSVNARPELIKMAFTLRRATVSDADEIAYVYSASFQLLTFLPMLHTTDEYRWFIANVILKECEVMVAEDETGIAAFIALKGEEVRLLHTRDPTGLAWVRARS